MKYALVTGGAGDIGRAIGRRLVADGWHVGVVDLDPAAVAETVQALGRATALPCDVTDEGALEAALDQLGAVPDLAVCNAGIGRFGPLAELTAADFRAVIEVNLTGAFLTARAAARRMIPQGRGSIVTVTSINALTPGPGAGAYPAAKAGLARLTEQMALEWGPLGLRANAVAPGFIETDMTHELDDKTREAYLTNIPMKRLGKAKEVADVCVFLGSDMSAYVTGQVLSVCGGLNV